MAALVVVGSGVAAGRVVAAADVPAAEADPQMQPAVAQFQAFFAPGSAWNNVTNFHEMFAKNCHALPLLACPPCW